MSLVDIGCVCCMAGSVCCVDAEAMQSGGQVQAQGHGYGIRNCQILHKALSGIDSNVAGMLCMVSGNIVVASKFKFRECR